MTTETLKISERESDYGMKSIAVKPKILVTEDDPENQKLFELILKKEFDLVICDSEKSFFNNIKQYKYSVILMDVNLKGGKTGLEIIKELRKKSEYQDIPVICLSADMYGQDKARITRLGIDAYMTKPVNNKLLVSTIKKLIDGKE